MDSFSIRLLFFTVGLVLLPGAWGQSLPNATGANINTVPSADPPTVSVYVVLEGDPVIKAAAGGKTAPALANAGSSTRLRARQIQAQHAALENRLAGLGAKVTGHLVRLANAIKVRVPAAQLRQLEALPGVVRLDPVRRYRPRTQTSVPFIGAAKTWGPFSATQTNLDGRGVRVGVIDTGIDYTHADFGGSGRVEDFVANNPTRIEPGSFPTAKVVGGYDFAGENYSADDPDNALPQPDPDPIDSLAQGHGTHVAGIIAGLGVLTNGATYTGPYSAALDFSQFAVGPGVAPGALLYALKVFGSRSDSVTDLTTDALEWAADPNGDYDLSDRLDVVNLSLGGQFGTLTAEDTERSALNHLVELGCVVVAAAGNDGNVFYITDAPGVVERALSVASSLDDGIEQESIEITAPASIAGRYYAVEGEFTAPLAKTGPITGKVVYADPPDATADLVNAADIQGNIVLIDRGTALFTEKIKRAQAAGAIAVIMVNNVEGPPFTMGGTEPSVVIPGVMISQANGALLKSNLAAPVMARLDATLTAPSPELADQMNDFSSRGPGSPASYLKPEIAAPGTEILSAAAGTGTNGVQMSGTSMATPHVAGAAALLKQLHPSWPAEDIKAALMNTAVPTRDADGNLYPESRTGAGRVQLDRAAQLAVTAVADSGAGLVGLSYGSLELTNLYREVRQVQLRNHSGQPVTFEISVSNTVAAAGIRIASRTNSVTVPANGFALVPLELTADPALLVPNPDPTTPPIVDNEARQFLNEASGEIWFVSPSSSNPSLHLPYYANARAAADFHVDSPRVVLPAGTNAHRLEEVALPVRGSSVHPQPLVSVFELGVANPNRLAVEASTTMAELLAVGAASDIATNQSVSDSTVFFGIATAGSWTTPQPDYVQFDIFIDTNRDGLAEFVLENGNTDTTGDAYNDVLITRVQNVETDEMTQGGYLNIYPADQLETAPFNNSVIILSAPAYLLGLTENHSQIRYLVRTYDSMFFPGGSRRLVDETPWILFDVARPVVDTAASGLDGTPLHDDGIEITVRVDRALAAERGESYPGVLVLHHFNTAGRRLELVRLDLTQDDSDADGIPDWWEMLQFDRLDIASEKSDQDQDGFPDWAEFRAGTNPGDNRSLLRLFTPKITARGQVELKWSSIAARNYAVQGSTNSQTGFTDLFNDPIAATPPVNSIIDTNAPHSTAYFYRIKLD